MNSSDKLLKDLARDDSQILGARAEAMRARIARQASADLIQAVHLAHARAREAVVAGARMSLRCGALLLKGGGDWAGLLRATGISEQAAASYVALALAYPELAAIASHRRGRITEPQALAALVAMGYDGTADPVAHLRALRGLQA